MYLFDTWYLFFCMDDFLVCRVLHFTLHARQLSIQSDTKCRIDTVVSADDGYVVARNL